VPEPLVIVGATATGKSDLAMAIARNRPGTEIVSVDSMQVYRGMDIGTAKPTKADRAEIPHHCLDLVDPSQEFTLTQFQAAVSTALSGIEARGGSAVLVGGTGLYVRAVVDDLTIPGRYQEARDEIEGEPDTALLHRRLAALDPVAAARMEPTNRRRIVRALEVCVGSGEPFSSFGPGLDAYPPNRFRQIGLQRSRELIDQRIAERYQRQLQRGFVREVEVLRGEGVGPTARQALGYREILGHIEQGIDLQVAIDEAVRRTRKFARRQERWFMRDPRITWMSPDDDTSQKNPVAALVNGLGESTPCS
jgi:tRNA dimethylallyltransferase